MAVVVEQPHDFKPHVRPPRCRLQSCTHIDFFMLETDPVDLAHSLGQAVKIASFHRSFSTPCLTLTPKVEEVKPSPKIEIIGGKGDHRVRTLVAEVSMALDTAVEPVPISNGLGGTYLLSGRNRDALAVAKPIDEEPLACNNPKGLTGRMPGQPGLKRSVKLGETGVREVAAFLLDHGQFAGVPPTALVKIFHVPFHLSSLQTVSTPAPPHKVASLQRFVEHDCDAGDLGPTSFSVSCVHRIGILDVRLLNIDRHSGNILVRKHRENISCSINGEAELVPIDHGLCLPEWVDDPYFEWMHWPQASIPFSEPELEYITNLDPFADANLLRTELPGLVSESSIRVLVVCTIFLKQAACFGLCLGDIGEMMTRECCGGEETQSVLESICVMAKDSICDPFNFIDGIDDIVNCETRGKGHEEEEEKEEVEEEDYNGNDDDRDFDVFQFDEDFDGSSGMIMDAPSDVFLKPPFLAKPPPIPKFLSETVKGKGEIIENEDHSFSNNNNNKGCLWRSVSFGVPNRSNEAGGVSFEDLSEIEWECFLQVFEKLLPSIFEERVGIASTQRLGTSCEF